MTSNKQSLGNFHSRLASAMEIRNVKQGQLAKLSGVQQGTVSNWLSGKRGVPRGDTAVMIAKALDVSVEWLLTGEVNEPYSVDPQPMDALVSPSSAGVITNVDALAFASSDGHVAFDGPEVAARLQRVIRSKGLKMADVARQMGLNSGTITNIFTGNRSKRPSAPLLMQIAETLDVSLDWLLTGKEHSVGQQRGVSTLRVVGLRMAQYFCTKSAELISDAQLSAVRDGDSAMDRSLSIQLDKMREVCDAISGLYETSLSRASQ